MVGDPSTPPLRPQDIVFVCSASGKTAGVCLLAGQAKAAGGHIITVTGQAGSQLAALADQVIELPAAGKRDRTAGRSQQFAGSLFEQALLLLFDALFYVLSHRSGQDADTLWARHANLE
ncbi:SIS domain-containing protein [Streptomyces lavendulae]|uniref:SIS domain-containing protein n=1 Tax=Streptomyces lavendulae TaxID=1914 RepID=UPI00249FB49C|nr:hypothetical protein Slala05_84150 [Streptomyces lavendulae subsp. lavendulae]